MDTILAHLESSRQDFLAEAAGLAPGRAAARPADGAWSILDVVEHIATVEIGVLEVFRTRMFAAPCPPEFTAKTAGKDQLIVDAMRDRTARRQSPDLVKPAGRWPSAALALDAFDQARSALIALLRAEPRDLRAFCAPHPSLKALDAYQWLLFVTTHTERHREQIREIKAGLP
jgi:hypothetical protein